MFRKVNRTINDFSPEQMANLSAIVWLYRGQKERFIGLVDRYLGRVRGECGAVAPALKAFDATMAEVRTPIESAAAVLAGTEAIDQAAKTPAVEGAEELREAAEAYLKDRKALLAELAKSARNGAKPAATVKPLHAARAAFDPLAERLKGLVKQIDLLYKLADRGHDQFAKLLSALGDEVPDGLAYDRRGAGKLLKRLDEERQAAVEQLREAVYFHRQAAWLLDRFPDAKLADVPGLVKLASLAEIEAADWSLTPGRYVGVAPAEVDDDFDFEQTLRDIHAELADLNQEAAELVETIQKNFEGLGI